jgi:hypothetical protein
MTHHFLVVHPESAVRDWFVSGDFQPDFGTLARTYARR